VKLLDDPAGGRVLGAQVVDVRTPAEIERAPLEHLA